MTADRTKIKKAEESTLQLVFAIFKCLTIKRQRQYKGIILLIIISSAAEILSLGAVIPFLTAMTDPNILLKNNQIAGVLKTFSIDDERQLIFWIAIGFSCAAIISGLLRYALLHTITRTSFSAGAELGTKIFKNLVYSSYSYHISTNSSEHIDVVTTKVNNIIFNVVTPALMLISSVIIILSITGFLIAINPIIAVTSIGFFLAIYSLISLIMRKNLSADASVIANKSSNLVKQLQEVISGIRDVIIDNCQDKVIERFSITNNSLRRSQGNNQIRSQSPRYLVESVGVVFIAFVTYYLTVTANGSSSAIPIIGALALSSQKILPLAQSAFSAYANIHGSRASIIEVLRMANLKCELQSKRDEFGSLSFVNKITIENVSFAYATQSKYVLNNINLDISRGDKIGIIGATGSGKSTLIDILLGLLEPTSGAVKVDGCLLSSKNITNWQKRISHVPQNIFLTDSTFAENIAYGVNAEEINQERLRHAIKLAVLNEYVGSLDLGIHSQVGERGVQLSGGQCQRVGIARAIYKQADVLILDEATSSLDSKTEEAVISSIMEASEDLTIIMIAHRTTTLRFCNKIFMLKDGDLILIGSYSDLIDLNIAG